MQQVDRLLERRRAAADAIAQWPMRQQLLLAAALRLGLPLVGLVLAFGVGLLWISIR